METRTTTIEVIFVHASTESADHYYFACEGPATDADIREWVTGELAQYDEEGYIEHIERFTAKVHNETTTP